MKLCEHHLIGVLKVDPKDCWLRDHSSCSDQIKVRMWRGGEYVDLTAKFTTDRNGENFILMEEQK